MSRAAFVSPDGASVAPSGGWIAWSHSHGAQLMEGGRLVAVATFGEALAALERAGLSESTEDRPWSGVRGRRAGRLNFL